VIVASWAWALQRRRMPIRFGAMVATPYSGCIMDAAGKMQESLD
jgi:hypothetical protein